MTVTFPEGTFDLNTRYAGFMRLGHEPRLDGGTTHWWLEDGDTAVDLRLTPIHQL
jgi:hypothetical protein